MAERRVGAETSCSFLAVVTAQGQEIHSHVAALAGCQDSGEHLENFLMYLRVWTVTKVKGSLPLLVTLRQNLSSFIIFQNQGVSPSGAYLMLSHFIEISSLFHESGKPAIELWLSGECKTNLPLTSKTKGVHSVVVRGKQIKKSLRLLVWGKNSDALGWLWQSPFGKVRFHSHLRHGKNYSPYAPRDISVRWQLVTSEL